MIEEFDKFLNCNEYLRNNLGVFIDAFIEYYGEEKREEIINKFSKMIPIAYISPENVSNRMNELKKYYTKEIFNKFKEMNPTIYDQNDLLSFYELDDITHTPLVRFQNFYELYSLSKEERIERFKQKSFKSIHSWLPSFTFEEYEEMIASKKIPEKYDRLPGLVKNSFIYSVNLDNAEEEFKKTFDLIKDLVTKAIPDASFDNLDNLFENEEIKNLLKYIEALPEMTNEFNSKMSKYSYFIENIKIEQEQKMALEEEYYLKFIEENKELLTEEELKILVESKNKKNVSLPKRVTSIFGSSLNGNINFEAFSEENDEVLKDESSWRQKSIIRDRITYFKENGINLGDNYEDYLNSEEVLKIIPSKEVIEKVINSKKKIMNEYNNVLYTSKVAHRKIREEIDQYNLMDKDDSFNAQLYTSIGSTFVSPNVVKTENGYDLMSLVVISCNGSDRAIDHNIVHELNHLYELHLINANETSNDVICGWDEMKTTYHDFDGIVDFKERESKRPYELFNEIINEKIAQEIYSKMVEKGIYIFNNESNAKVTNTTSYENTSFLVNDFFNEFKDEIIQSRNEGNIEIIWNKVGKENFDALNELFDIFNKNFQGFKFHIALKNIHDNVKTDETLLLADLSSKKDAIMEKMREYALSVSIDNTQKTL